MFRSSYTLLILVAVIVICGDSEAREDISTSNVVVEFKSSATVERREYKLNDIAHVSTSNANTLDILENLIVGVSPRPGQSVEISQYKVSARLERKIPGISHQLKWLGRPTLRVRSTGTLADSHMIAKTAERKLSGWLTAYLQKSADFRFNVRLIGKDKELYLPLGEVKYTARTSEAARLRSRMSVWVDVSVDDTLFTTIPVWFAVAAQKRVMVANQDFDRHEVITAQSVMFEERDIAGLSTIAFDKLPTADHRVRRNINAGQVILEDHLELVPDIQKGQIVTVHAQHGAVAVAVKARALSDGLLNDEITVENPETLESYAAIVIRKDHARVD